MEFLWAGGVRETLGEFVSSSFRTLIWVNWSIESTGWAGLEGIFGENLFLRRGRERERGKGEGGRVVSKPDLDLVRISVLPLLLSQTEERDSAGKWVSG
jgi:hypothetical protein